MPFATSPTSLPFSCLDGKFRSPESGLDSQTDKMTEVSDKLKVSGVGGLPWLTAVHPRPPLCFLTACFMGLDEHLFSTLVPYPNLNTSQWCCKNGDLDATKALFDAGVRWRPMGRQLSPCAFPTRGGGGGGRVMGQPRLRPVSVLHGHRSANMGVLALAESGSACFGGIPMAVSACRSLVLRPSPFHYMALSPCATRHLWLNPRPLLYLPSTSLCGRGRCTHTTPAPPTIVRKVGVRCQRRDRGGAVGDSLCGRHGPGRYCRVPCVKGCHC